MQIYSAKTKMVEKWVEVEVSHEHLSFTISVRTKDGKVVGNHKSGMATAKLIYFDEVPDKIRAKHFEQIKAYVEKHIR